MLYRGCKQKDMMRLASELLFHCPVLQVQVCVCESQSAHVWVILLLDYSHIRSGDNKCGSDCGWSYGSCGCDADSGYRCGSSAGREEAQEVRLQLMCVCVCWLAV